MSPTTLFYFSISVFLSSTVFHPFFMHPYSASHQLFPTYLHTHIRVRINVPAKSRYWHFPLQTKQPWVLPIPFPPLLLFYSSPFGIKQWARRCCMGTAVLTPNSSHLVMAWPTRSYDRDLVTHSSAARRGYQVAMVLIQSLSTSMPERSIILFVSK